MKTFFSILFIFSFLSFSCTQTMKVKTGVINDSILCASSKNQYYSIYLPKAYDSKLPLPILYFFDPSGRAKTPLEKYKLLAEEYNIIMACSYNSKNGPVEKNKTAANAMIKDSKSRYLIDTTKIILSGFSGGSRFAYSYGQKNESIYGVIGCGAFFPGGENKSKPLFKYSGITGVSDFNYREGLLMYQTMSQMRIPFQFIVYEGEHDWPSDSIFVRALVYQLAGESTQNQHREACINLERLALQQSKKQKDWINSFLILQNLAILDKTYSDSLFKLITEKEYKRQEKEFSKSLLVEDSLIKVITDATRGIIMKTYNQYDNYKPVSWWRKEIDKLSGMENNSKKLYFCKTGKRMKGYIGISLWESNRRLVKEKYFEEALEMAEILVMVNDTSDTYHALKAESLVALERMEEAKSEFKIAIEYGFTMENEYLKGNAYLKKIVL